MTCGVLMYAHNNSEIDYFKIACANALMVQKNLNVPVTLVSDETTLNWGTSSLGKDFIESCFEKVILVNKDNSFGNKKMFSDTKHTTKTLPFYNCNHWEAYNLSPYDETLFIDADYLIMSDALNRCWGSINDLMVDHRIYSPGDTQEPRTRFIDNFGIRQYWATVTYFKKTEFTKMFFELVKHVQDNYRYYKDLYYFQNNMFRNDHAFSVAIHTLNGFANGANTLVGNLPIPGLLMVWDDCDIHSVSDINSILIYASAEKGSNKFSLLRIKNTDVHIMNKWAINRVSDKLIELYK